MNNQQPLRIVLLLLCVALFAATPVFALPASASLHGVVTDPSGARVTKATITLQAEDGTITTVQSGADGAYIFPQLAPGTYTITVTAKGLALGQAQSVSIDAGRAVLENLAVIAVDQQQVTVTDQ